MKLLFCVDCGDVVRIINKWPLSCLCDKHRGKYLSDNITAVVTKGCMIVGIDNNSFMNAAIGIQNLLNRGHKTRFDLYFTGWIPTHPGEVIYVKTVEDVTEFPYECDMPVYTSTLPTSTD